MIEHTFDHPQPSTPVILRNVGKSVLLTVRPNCYSRVLHFVSKTGKSVQQIDQVLIPVEKIDPGMFPSESAIKLRGSDGKFLTLFADQRLIEKRGDRNFLRVTRLETDSMSGISVCLLPVDTAEGTRWIRIRTNELQAA